MTLVNSLPSSVFLLLVFCVYLGHTSQSMQKVRIVLRPPNICMFVCANVIYICYISLPIMAMLTVNWITFTSRLIRLVKHPTEGGVHKPYMEDSLSSVTSRVEPCCIWKNIPAFSILKRSTFCVCSQPRVKKWYYSHCHLRDILWILSCASKYTAFIPFLFNWHSDESGDIFIIAIYILNNFRLNLFYRKLIYFFAG